jgi:hypothetical protein
MMRDGLEDNGVGGRIILKMNLETRLRKCEMDWDGLGKGGMTNF